MRRVYVSTVGRGRELEEASKVYCLDFDSGEILASVQLPKPLIDVGNPRGGCRGARGLTFCRGQLLAANCDGVFHLDCGSLEVLAGHQFTECRDIHQIYTRDGVLQLISTANNRCYRFGAGGLELEFDLTGMFEGVENTAEPTDTLHFNAYCPPYVSLNKISRIGNVKNGEVSPFAAEAPHDLAMAKSGELLVNCSAIPQTVALRFARQINRPAAVRPVLCVPGGPVPENKLARIGWLRGMAYLPECDQLLVGTSPAGICVVSDVCSGPRHQRTIPISDEVVDSVFDVCIHPDDWGVAVAGKS